MLNEVFGRYFVSPATSHVHKSKAHLVLTGTTERTNRPEHCTIMTSVSLKRQVNRLELAVYHAYTVLCPSFLLILPHALTDVLSKNQQYL